MHNFSTHDHAWRLQRLAEPAGRVRIVIDTDAANEIDDQFALAWALLSPAQLQVDAVYATPFSFEHRRQEMLRALAVRDRTHPASVEEQALLRRYRAQLDYFERQQWPLATVDLPVFNPPAVGMERSHAEILRVFNKLGLPAEGKVFRGSAGYLADLKKPLDSDAVQHLIRSARATPQQDPLYVVAIGCVTNIASALLMAPDIIDKIVVVWTAGFPSHAPQPNHAFNLEQDMLATHVLLDSGVPLVYLPGYHVGAQLRLSLAEMDRHVLGRGAIGNYLHQLFTHNPLWPFLGLDGAAAHSWVIWDVINIAWLINPAWVPSDIVATPGLGDDKRWLPQAGRHAMREAYGVARDAIFQDFFNKLATAPA